MGKKEIIQVFITVTHENTKCKGIHLTILTSSY